MKDRLHDLEEENKKLRELLKKDSKKNKQGIRSFKVSTEMLKKAMKMEAERIRFLINRDGLDSAIAFSKRSKNIYLNALKFKVIQSRGKKNLIRPTAKTEQYYYLYIGSVFFYRKFLRDTKFSTYR